MLSGIVAPICGLLKERRRICRQTAKSNCDGQRFEWKDLSVRGGVAVPIGFSNDSLAAHPSISAKGLALTAT